MSKEIVTLNLVIETISFPSARVTLAFIQDTLENIDRITLKYLNKEEYFNHKKPQLLNEIKEKTNLIISDIYLKEIYIETNEKRISPLFEQISYKDKYIPLDDIIKYRLMQGNLEKLYKISQELNNSKLFANIPEEILEELNNHYLTPRIINIFFENIKTSPDYYKLVRILLLNTTLEKLKFKYQKYLDETKETKKHTLTKSIRLPYKDN